MSANRLLHRFIPAALLLATALCPGSCVRIDESESWKKNDPVPQEEEPLNFNVWGKVTGGGEGLGDVVVSDGVDVVLTDANGEFSFKSDKKNGYVFISVPSGYEAPLNGVQPGFFKYLKKDAAHVDSLSFRLDRVDQSRYTMLFFGDMHLADRAVFRDLEQFGEFASEVKESLSANEGRTYALTLGDMAWDRFWITNRYDLNSYLAEMNRYFSGRLPVFHTMGNHDNDPSLAGDFLAETTYKSILGPTYYSFNIGGVHYIVLDDILYLTEGDRAFYKEISAEQEAWLRKDLEHVSKKTPLVLTMHSPLYDDNGKTSLYNGFNTLITHLRGYKSTFITGHTHVNYNVDNTSMSVPVYESNSGAVCGAWWVTASNSGIHLASDGAPGGYRIMDVNGTSFSWKYKGTGKSADEQFRTYDRNSLCLSAEKWTPDATETGRQAFLEAVGDYAVEDRTNSVLLNVWDYDPSWKIKVTENGKELEAVQLKDVKDPLYLVCYEAYEYEHHYDNSVYYPASKTNHIFKVKASSATSTLQITVTDRFGRSYSETMKRPKEFSVAVYGGR